MEIEDPGSSIGGVNAGRIWGSRSMFIPELRAMLFPGKDQTTIYSGLVLLGPKESLHLSNVTVREILSAVTIATETPRVVGRCRFGQDFLC